MDRVTVLFHTESHFPVNKVNLKKAITEALKGKVKRQAEVSVRIVGDRQMRKLNRKFRQVDATTDVLSFPLNESNSSNQAFIEPPDDILRLGDIVVSYPQAVVEAREDNTMVEEKLILLILHGLNHLLGIHHPE